MSLQLGSDGLVYAAVYDLAGQEIDDVVHDFWQRGQHTIDIPVSNLSSGKYLFVVRSMGWAEIRPFVIDK